MVDASVDGICQIYANLLRVTFDQSCLFQFRVMKPPTSMYRGLKVPFDCVRASGGFAAIAKERIWAGHWREDLNAYDEQRRNLKG